MTLKADTFRSLNPESLCELAHVHDAPRFYARPIQLLMRIVHFPEHSYYANEDSRQMAIITLGIGGYIVKREGIAALEKSCFTAVCNLRLHSPIAPYSLRQLKCKSLVHEEVSVAYGL